MPTTIVDARGLLCPLPLLKAKKALNELNPGQIVEVLATDSGSMRDFTTFCELSDNKLLTAEETEGEYLYQIEKTQRQNKRRS